MPRMPTLKASFATVFVAAMVLTADSEEISATSPDGRVKCDFSIEDGLPVADVSFCGRHAFRTELGMDFGRMELAKSTSRTVRSSWKPVWGFKSEYPENYTELELKLVREECKGDEQPSETLYLRCYDEGFAARAGFVMPPYDVSSIAGERTRWRFAPGAAAWGIRTTEGTFPEDPAPIESMTGDGWRRP